MIDRRVPFTDLAPSESELLRRAHAVAPLAFNPVSRFHVGSAVRADDGRVHCGTFFESSSFPLGVCAESAALAAAITDGVRAFTTVAVVGGDPHADRPGQPVTPCGGCRQRIFDLTGAPDRNVVVLCSDLSLSHIYRVHIRDLLPLAFSAKDLPESIG
ncbi:cytidine deaminase [Streptomyces sp. NPDC059477]|uniref:cytidine deaminase n=1 Tax=Streptomyces sp. NPDC059477 TaxID=3346847 RepID=UPI0036B7CD9C